MSAEATNSSNIALGSVTMCTRYNVLDPNFRSKAEMEGASYCMSCKPSCDMMIHPIECDLSMTPQDILYTRSGVIPSGADPRLYDLCNFQIATSGFQGASVDIGELWVTYEFAFFKFRLWAALGYTTDFYDAISTVPPTSLNPLGVPLTLSSRNTIELPSITAGGASTFTFTLPSYPQPVRYSFYLRYDFSASTVSSSYTFAISNGTATLVEYGPSPGSSNLFEYRIFDVQCNGGSLPNVCTITRSVALPAVTTSFHCVLTLVPN